MKCKQVHSGVCSLGQCAGFCHLARGTSPSQPLEAFTHYILTACWRRQSLILGRGGLGTLSSTLYIASPLATLTPCTINWGIAKWSEVYKNEKCSACSATFWSPELSNPFSGYLIKLNYLKSSQLYFPRVSLGTRQIVDFWCLCCVHSNLTGWTVQSLQFTNYTVLLEHWLPLQIYIIQVE